jgi:polysaccharide export outer membrane protein
MSLGSIRIEAVLALGLALSALAGQQQQQAQPNPVRPNSSATDVKAPAAANPGMPTSGMPQAVAVDPKSYKIGAEDVIGVRVWREPEISGSYTVRPDGKISMPLVKEIQAVGLTPEQLEKDITEKLGAFYTRPDVNVSVLAVLSKKYSIIGSVNRTGSFPLVMPTTVLDALAGAGGFHEFANTKKITIVRGSKRLSFNYNDVVKGKHLDENVLLENGDLIIVR